jgi:hypothetical protein
MKKMRLTFKKGIKNNPGISQKKQRPKICNAIFLIIKYILKSYNNIQKRTEILHKYTQNTQK